MQILFNINALRNALERVRQQGGQIAFVPTMGNLHAGHLSLIEQARSVAPLARDCVVASIFVNRLQFGPNEDFTAYPRTFDADCAQLEAAGVDLLFAPDENELYPEIQHYQIALPEIAQQLDGAVRPGHFRGVATVVLKLFNIVQPQSAVFGKKDYQQLMIVRNMVRQLALPIRILSGETIRAEDGLALSSRNRYLAPSERPEAARLYRVLSTLCCALKAAKQDIAQLEQQAFNELSEHGWRVDYISVRRQDDLEIPGQTHEGSIPPALVALGAARLGKTRLIDNLEIS
ncbi:MAG: pantoate--beta-alanine ligase [Pseudomonadota bacterium]